MRRCISADSFKSCARSTVMRLFVEEPLSLADFDDEQ
jgi:hypothetical protein